jgi:hypothetical protein
MRSSHGSCWGSILPLLVCILLVLVSDAKAQSKHSLLLHLPRYMLCSQLSPFVSASSQGLRRRCQGRGTKPACLVLRCAARTVQLASVPGLNYYFTKSSINFYKCVHTHGLHSAAQSCHMQPLLEIAVSSGGWSCCLMLCWLRHWGLVAHAPGNHCCCALLHPQLCGLLRQHL